MDWLWSKLEGSLRYIKLCLVNKQTDGLACSSVIECWPSLYKALGSILSTGRKAAQAARPKYNSWALQGPCAGGQLPCHSQAPSSQSNLLHPLISISPALVALPRMAAWLVTGLAAQGGASSPTVLDGVVPKHARLSVPNLSVLGKLDPSPHPNFSRKILLTEGRPREASMRQMGSEHVHGWEAWKDYLASRRAPALGPAGGKDT